MHRARLKSRRNVSGANKRHVAGGSRFSSHGATCEPLEQRMMYSAAVSAALTPSVTAQDNQTYVEGLIGATQLSAPKQAALDHKLTKQLNAGASRQTVALELINSAPSRAVQVQTLYLDLLHRSPTPAQLQAGVALIQAAGDSRPLEVAIIGSAEYRRVRGGGTNDGFITALYQDVVDRAPTSTEQSAALKSLSRGATRADVARKLMKSTEALTLMVENAQAPLGPEASAPSAQDIKDVSRPGGVSRKRASALASDTVYQQIVNPAPTSPPPASPPTPPGYPVATGFDLNSSVQPLAVSSGFILGDLYTLSAGTDDVLWLASNTGLATYGNDTGTMTSIYSTGPVDLVSAITATEAYAVMGGTNAIVHFVNGVPTSLPALPANDVAAQISASSDGVVWVQGQSGTIYSFSSGTQTWSTISADGYSIKEISVGSATNIWALTSSGAVLQYTTGSGFQPSTLTGSVGAIAATADGAVWADTDGYIEMKPSYGTFQLIKVQSTDISLLFFTAGSMNYAYQAGAVNGASELTGQINLVSVGVVDRQPVPFPTYTGEEESAYTYISQAAGVPDIRALYQTPSEISDTVVNDIANVTDPSNIPSVDFDPVYTELNKEVAYVQGVYNRFNAIENNVLTPIQVINDAQLSSAAVAVGLEVNNTPSDSTVRIILEDLFEAIAGSISSSGIPAASAVVAAFLASGFSSGISAYENANNVTPGNAVAISYVNLQTQLDGIYQSALVQLNNDLTSILGDLGQLTAVGQAVGPNGAWPYYADTPTDAVAATTNAYAKYFYQVLVAAKWQIVTSGYGDYVENPVTQILTGVPLYDLEQIPDGYRDGILYENVYFANELNGPSDWNTVDLGPFPTSTMITNIDNLSSTSATDFWTGQDGWSVIKQVVTNT